MEDKDLRSLALPLLGKWSLFIVYELDQGPRHFSAFEKAIPGLSRKVLTSNLRDLEASGLIKREGLRSTGHKVFYQLTPLGESLMPLLYEIKSWLKAHAQEIQAQQRAYVLKG